MAALGPRAAGRAMGRNGVATDRDRDEVAREERASTTDERRAAGAPEGIEPAAPDYADDSGRTDLGVAEPRVEPDQRGTDPQD